MSLLIANSAFAFSNTDTVNISIVLGGVGAGNTLLAVAGINPVSGSAGVTLAIPTDNNVSQIFSNVAIQPTGDNPYATGALAWLSTNAIAATHNVTFNFSAQFCSGFAGLIDIPASTFDQGANAITARGVTVGNISSNTLSTSTGVVIAAIAFQNEGAAAANIGIVTPTGWTALYTQQSTANVPGQVAYINPSNTSPVTASWHWTTSGEGAMVLVSIAGSAGPAAKIFRLYANGAFQANSFVQSTLPSGIALRLYAGNNAVHCANLVQSGAGKTKIQANGQLIVNNTIIV